VKALLFSRSVPRFAAARVAGTVAPGLGARVGPLHLSEVDEPELPGSEWQVVRPRLSGICGSDLATIDGHASRYFEPIVSFPFVPGHEVVGELDSGRRVVVEPVLSCVTRRIDPPCPDCAAGRTNRCRHVAFGALEPGLQTGYCADTGGGWGLRLVAHPRQLHDVPDAMADEAAVMVEPTACAVHGALHQLRPADDRVVVVIGAGTLGLCALAALRHFGPEELTVITVAKHPGQRRLARDLGADIVAEPHELGRAVRRVTGTMITGDRLAGGADLVIDCAGTEQSLADALSVARPGGRVTLVGMPGRTSLDLTGLWHKEIRLTGAYAYGIEPLADGRRTFELAFELVAAAGLERLVSATYTLERFQEAIEHAAQAGRRGAVKVVFDLRKEKRR
jgi:threonine dehydrogenase-like Zn-dependent dehydrogenase